MEESKVPELKKEMCPCKKINCERHGDCVACREYHARPDSKYLTACDRLNKKKKVRK